MIRYCKLFLCLTIAILLAWQLPWCYAFLTLKADPVPFTLYSPLAGDFISIGMRDGGKGLQRFDTQGHTYTQQQTDSLLPWFYVRQLTADERFPDSICGVAVSPKEIQLSNFTFRSIPADLNKPELGLYFLLESASGRVDLQMPSDVFRITNKGMEFVDMEHNALEKEKGLLFTEALKQQGFAFPARRIAGNPGTKKEYDGGYLLIDSHNRMFRLRMMEGRPRVDEIPMPKDVVPMYAFVTENRDRRTIGYFTDTRHHFYVINADRSVVKSGIPSVDPARASITIFGNMFAWTVKVDTPHDVYLYALDANNYSLIREHAFKDVYPTVEGLTFTSPDDKFVKPRF